MLSLTAAVVLVAASSVFAQTCIPQFTAGAPYDINWSINSSYVWLFNGASAGTIDTIHLTPVPPGFSAWYFDAADSGTWTITSESSPNPEYCVTAPSNSTGDALKLLSYGLCSDSTNTDLTISCQSCAEDGSATNCTLFVSSHDECVNIPGDISGVGDPSIRTLECTGSSEQLWDIVAFSDE